jgi:hypothetical protein
MDLLRFAAGSGGLIVAYAIGLAALLVITSRQAG